MKKIGTSFEQIVNTIPSDIKLEVELEFAISNRLFSLLNNRGLSKIELAKSLGKRPSEVTKWLSGQHNFTLRTISMLSAFFGEPLIQVYNDDNNHLLESVHHRN
ncbi:MAG: helix-turn-helix transcriptional regulator [Bacteroidales bacterium]|nr:helix-turn-helix transcriptional regulator [Bacteroidales bacterium]